MCVLFLEISLKLLMTGKYKVCSHSKCWMWLWQGSQWTRWQVLYCEPARTRQAELCLQGVPTTDNDDPLSSSLPSLPPLLLIYRLPRFCWNNKCRTRCAVICIVVMLLRWLRSGHTLSLLPLIWWGTSHVTQPPERQPAREHKLPGFQFPALLVIKKMLNISRP